MNTELRKKARNIFEENFLEAHNKLIFRQDVGKQTKQNKNEYSAYRNQATAKVVPELIEIIPNYTQRPCYNNIQSELNPVG